MTTVIFHSADFDGLFCREIAKHFLGPGNDDNPNQYIGWNFGDPKVATIADQIYILDLSPDCLANETDNRKVTWIDHHKTSIEKWGATGMHDRIPGYRIDGVAACRLAWQWFEKAHEFGNPPLLEQLPTKDQFLNRQVQEPLAIQLAGEYDVWDKRNSNAETFQYGLRCNKPIWATLLNVKHPDHDNLINDMLADGRVAQYYARNMDSDLVLSRSFLMQWEGLIWLCLNTGHFNSITFAALDKPETGHDALLGFNWNGKIWTVSLYHASHRTDLDLSPIAMKYGGGGHRGAAGMVCKELPFPLTGRAVL